MRTRHLDWVDTTRRRTDVSFKTIFTSFVQKHGSVTSFYNFDDINGILYCHEVQVRNVFHEMLIQNLFGVFLHEDYKLLN